MGLCSIHRNGDWKEVGILKNTLPLLILAGGKASRLGKLATETPKFLMPVADGMTFADVQLQWAKNLGFQEIFLSIGHLGDHIEAYCKDGSRWGLHITYLRDGQQPLGTGGAVAASLKLPFEQLAITYGDTLLEIPLPEIQAKLALHPEALGVMTLFRNTLPGHQCNATLNGDWVIYDKAQPQPDWTYIDYGFLLLKRSLIAQFPIGENFDLTAPLSIASRKRQLLGHVVAKRFWEIGSPEALQEFRKRDFNKSSGGL